MIAQSTSQERTREAADQCATVCPADEPCRIEMKVGFIKRLCSADDDPVVAEKESTHRRNKGDHPDITEPKFTFEGLARWRSSRYDLHDYLF